MPKQGQDTSLLPFPGGLNTEANRFDYPSGCTVDEQNFITTKDGKRERRLGIILADDDVNMSPEGITYNDTLKILTKQEDGTIEAYTDYSTETWQEYENYNITATYTGCTSYTLEFENSTKFIVNIYGGGIYAETYYENAIGKQILIEKFNKGDMLTLPFRLSGWDSNNTAQPQMYIELNESADIEGWLNKGRTFTSYKNVTYTSEYEKNTSGTVGSGLSSYSTYYCHRVGKHTWNFPNTFKEKPTVQFYMYFWSSRNKPRVHEVGWNNLKTDEIDTLTTTKLVTKVGSTHYDSDTSKRNCKIKFRATGSVVDKYTSCSWIYQNGISSVYKTLTITKNETESRTVITGTGKRLVTKSKTNATPTYTSITDALSNPSNYIEVLAANYEKYTNKTRIQIGKLSSVADNTVPRYFLWKNAGGEQGTEFAVFYSSYKITICKSTPPYLFSNIVWETSSYGAQDIACVDGRLVIVNGNTDKVRCIEYSAIDEDFTEKEFVLMTRDLWGLSEKNVGKSTVKTATGSEYHKHGGDHSLTIKHNWNLSASDYTQYVSLACTGGKVTKYSHTRVDANTTKVSFTTKSGKSKTTAVFKLSYAQPASGTTTLDEDERCSPNNVRLYNLYNMGWGLPRKDEGGSKTNPVAVFLAEYNKYPSHKDSVFTALNLNPGYLDTNNNWTKAWERLYPELWDDSRNSEDARVNPAMGSAIIPVIYRGKGRWNWYWKHVYGTAGAISLTSLPNDYTEGGASCCCDYAGHMFYGGFSNKNYNGDDKTPHLGSYLFFSRIVRDYEDMEKCYQEGDPNSRSDADIVDTDGGFVRVSGAEGIIKLVQTQKGLLIFAQNGVWLLMGGSDYGFTATNHKISKLTSFGVNHRDSICGDGNTWMYFSDEGIMLLAPDQFGDLQCNNVSYNTIHTLFKDYAFPRYGVIGSYDPVTTVFHWMVECNSIYSTELLFNGSTKTWSHNVFYNDPDTGRYVLSPICFDEEFATNLKSTSTYRNYQSIAYLCRDSAIDDDPTSENYNQAINAEYRVGYCGNTYYMDFGINDAKAFLQSGPINAGNPGVYKQTPWLNAYMVTTENPDDKGRISKKLPLNYPIATFNTVYSTELEVNSTLGITTMWDYATKTLGLTLEVGDKFTIGELEIWYAEEDSENYFLCNSNSYSQFDNPQNISSAKVRCCWDWTTSKETHRWSPSFEIYRHRQPKMLLDGSPLPSQNEIVESRSKIRGRGKTMSYILETEAGRDCRIAGLNITMNGNSFK